MSVRLPPARVMSANLRLSGFGADQAGSLGGPTQRFDRLGSRHSLDVVLGPMRGACAAQLYAARLKARSTGDTLIMDFPRLPGLVNAIAGVQVDGADQVGNSLAVKGLPVVSRTNLLGYSQAFDNAGWGDLHGGTGSAAVVTADSIVAPDGTTTAESIVFNVGGGSSGDYSLLQQSGSVTPGRTYTASIWLKAPTPATYVLLDPSNNYHLIAITAVWQRFVLSGVSDGSMIFRFGLYNDVAGSAASGTLHAWGAQFESGSLASDYIPTTAAAVSVSSPKNVPAVNVLHYSNGPFASQWNLQASGTGIAPVVSSDPVLAPDGSMTATRIWLDRGAGTSGDYSVVSHTVNVLAGLEYCSSIWLRAPSPGQFVIIDLSNNFWRTVNVSSQWQRFAFSSFPSSAAAPVAVGLLQSYPCAIRGELQVWHAGVGPGDEPVDGIVTTSAAVTFYADLIPAGSPLSVVIDGSNYFYITADTVPDSGDPTQSILLDCQIRVSPADGASIELEKPQIEGYASGTDEAWSVGRTVADGLGFTLVERA